MYLRQNLPLLILVGFVASVGSTQEAQPGYRNPGLSAAQRAADLAIILARSRKGDALTIWHLLTRVDQGQRELVYDRLCRLVPPPASVTKEGIVQLDQPMLDLWWNALGFEDISVWRHWERSWSGATSGSALAVTATGR